MDLVFFYLIFKVGIKIRSYLSKILIRKDKETQTVYME